jgi:hypothetical protein
VAKRTKPKVGIEKKVVIAIRKWLDLPLGTVTRFELLVRVELVAGVLPVHGIEIAVTSHTAAKSGENRQVQQHSGSYELLAVARPVERSGDGICDRITWLVNARPALRIDAWSELEPSVNLIPKLALALQRQPRLHGFGLLAGITLTLSGGGRATKQSIHP